MNNRQAVVLIGSILLIIISLPYLVAPKLAGIGNEFGGFLINPLDGNTYLAKMYEGYQGEWLFTLPFTANHTQGAFLFEFYIFLGHVARWLHLPLLTVFHLARILSTILFLIALTEFLEKVIDLKGKQFTLCTALICFGSGLGWIFIFFGQATSDLWVAEAYPFLSSFSNPHFILGMALLLAILTRTEIKGRKNLAVLWILGILLGIIMPFAAVIAGVVTAAREGWRWFEERKINLFPALSILLGAGLVVSVQYWQILRDPFLSQWNTQNVTPGIPIWDLLVSLSPVILFAAVGLFLVVKNREYSQANKLLITWVITSLALVVFPFSLQRRFIFAIYIPLAILAVAGINKLASRLQRSGTSWFLSIFVLSCLTNVVIIFSGLSLVKNGNELMVIKQGEKAAFVWVGQNSVAGDIVLGSPALGNFIPGRTGRKVVYGHPFETVNARMREDEVNSFYANSLSIEEQRKYLIDQSIDWVIQGPRERTIGEPAILEELLPAFQNETVTVYKVAP